MRPLDDLVKGFRRKRAPPPGWLERHAPNGTLVDVDAIVRAALPPPPLADLLEKTKAL